MPQLSSNDKIFTRAVKSTSNRNNGNCKALPCGLRAKDLECAADADGDAGVAVHGAEGRGALARRAAAVRSAGRRSPIGRALQATARRRRTAEISGRQAAGLARVSSSGSGSGNKRAIFRVARAR